eukprot:scaffold151508_cov29-Tisochrysis_lutea.AAC.4
MEPSRRDRCSRVYFLCSRKRMCFGLDFLELLVEARFYRSDASSALCHMLRCLSLLGALSLHLGERLERLLGTAKDGPQLGRRGSPVEARPRSPSRAYPPDLANVHAPRLEHVPAHRRKFTRAFLRVLLAEAACPRHGRLQHCSIRTGPPNDTYLFFDCSLSILSLGGQRCLLGCKRLSFRREPLPFGADG